MEQKHNAADQIHLEAPGLSPFPPELLDNIRSANNNDPNDGITLAVENTQEEPPNSPEVEKMPESVIKLLLDRKEKGYQRGVDQDGHKVGLAFDPGAYAGVVSLSMAKSLQEAGLLDYVDAFYGLSAGGVNAAYVAMGQIEEGIDTYVNLMPDNGLLQMPSLKPPRSLKMNLDVLREAVYKIHPLKIKELVASRIPVVVGGTNLSKPLTPGTIFRSTEVDPDNPEEFIEQMIMGCNLPVIAGGPIKDKHGDEYSDATLAWANTVALAKADGCTEVLSLSNFAPTDKDISTRKLEAINKISGAIGDRYMAFKRPREYKQMIREQGRLWKIAHPLSYMLESVMGEGFLEYEIPSYSEALKKNSAAEKSYSEGLFIEDGVTVERIYPPNLPGLPELLTADKKRLRVGIYAGSLAVDQVLQNATGNQLTEAA